MKTLLLCAAAAGVLAAASPAMAAPADLEGFWDVGKSQRDGLAELDITRRGDSYQVRAAIVCSPRPCDLGNAQGKPLSPLGQRDSRESTSAVAADFDSSDASRRIIAQSSGRGRLSVTLIQMYKDGRPAKISTETFARTDDRGDDDSAGIEARCTDVSRMRIRFDGGRWTLSSGNTVVAEFNSPDEAGFARYLLQAHGYSKRCEIEGSEFDYWTTASGSLARGTQTGEYCTTLEGREIYVRESRGSYRVMSGNQVLYDVRDEGVADAIVDTLTDQGARSQCFVGEQGRGLTYFLR